jgi:hypothetical protein
MKQFQHKADLPSLLATVAASPIVVPAPKARNFADWCALQAPTDIDTVILDWLRSQASQVSNPPTH